MFNEDWKNIKSLEYINEARTRTGVLWLGHTYPASISSRINNNIHVTVNVQLARFEPDILVDIFNITETKARTYCISSASIWNEFIDGCYAVGISGNENERKEGWRAKDGVKEKFLDYMITEGVREKAVDDNYDPVAKNFFRYNILNLKMIL